MSGLDGRAVVVSGASSGIGAGVARELAAAGASVVLLGRDTARLRSVQESLPRPDRHTWYSVDLAGPREIAGLGEKLAADQEQVAALVHCAGVFDPKPFDQVSIKDLDRTWAVNVRAPFLLTQAVLPLLGAGSAVVFVSSVSGHVGMTRQSVYGTTKSAVDGLARTLAVELAPLGVRVNAVAPGFTATSMNAHLRAEPGRVERIEAATLLGRLGAVDEIARAVRFLATDDSSYVNGITLAVDGGYPVSHIQTGRAS